MEAGRRALWPAPLRPAPTPLPVFAGHHWHRLSVENDVPGGQDSAAAALVSGRLLCAVHVGPAAAGRWRAIGTVVDLLPGARMTLQGHGGPGAIQKPDSELHPRLVCCSGGL